MARKGEISAEDFGAIGKEVWRPEFAAGVASGATENPFRRSSVIVSLSLAILLAASGWPVFVIYPMLRWTMLGTSAAFFVLAAYLVVKSTARVRVPVLAVHERGLVLPKSVKGVPGFQQFAGPRAFVFDEIASATRVEDGENLLVVVKTNWGTGGVADLSMARPPLSAEQLRATLDAFCAALESVGVKVLVGDAGAMPAGEGDSEEASPAPD